MLCVVCCVLCVVCCVLCAVCCVMCAVCSPLPYPPLPPPSSPPPPSIERKQRQSAKVSTFLDSLAHTRDAILRPTAAALEECNRHKDQLERQRASLMQQLSSCEAELGRVEERRAGLAAAGAQVCGGVLLLVLFLGRGVRGGHTILAYPSPLTPHPSPLTTHHSPLTPHPSPLTTHPSLVL